MRHDRAALVQLLERGGYTVSYFAAKECDLAEALGQPAEIVVSAGGDGMVARIVAHARSDGPPIAILPLGTANNIANSLGIEGPLDELVGGWKGDPTDPRTANSWPVVGIATEPQPLHFLVSAK